MNAKEEIKFSLYYSKDGEMEYYQPCYSNKDLFEVLRNLLKDGYTNIRIVKK